MSPTERKRVEALLILRELGVRPPGRGDMHAFTLCAFAGVLPGDPWLSATGPMLTITQAMTFMRDHYGMTYAPNTRETVRFAVVNPMVANKILVDNPDAPRPKQSPYYCYQLEPTVLDLVRLF